MPNPLSKCPKNQRIPPQSKAALKVMKSLIFWKAFVNLPKIKHRSRHKKSKKICAAHKQLANFLTLNLHEYAIRAFCLAFNLS